MSLKVDVRKSLKGFSLEVAFDTEGYRQGILGASGCGKSMTLKMIAGIIKPDEGRIELNGKVLFDSSAKINISPQERRVGYLFQNYALFPHMNVFQNIKAGVKPGKENKVSEMIDSLQLKGLERRYPSQLSGGQQQRVALARCLAYEPQMIMLDEPFSALDEYLKELLQREVKEAIAGYEGEVILVTHNRNEVYGFCERITVLHNGKVVAKGETKQVFEHPVHVTAAKLSGCKNISVAKKIDENTLFAVDWQVALKVATPVQEWVQFVGVRAHHFNLYPLGGRSPENSSKNENLLPVKVLEIKEDLFETRFLIALGSSLTWCILPGKKDEGRLSGIKEEDHVILGIPGDKVMLLSGGNN